MVDCAVVCVGTSGQNSGRPLQIYSTPVISRLAGWRSSNAVDLCCEVPGSCFSGFSEYKVKVNLTLEQAMKAQRGSTGMVLLFL